SAVTDVPACGGPATAATVRAAGYRAGMRRRLRARPLRTVMRRRRLSWLDALLLVGLTTGSVVLLGAVLVRWLEPGRYPDLGSGLWWAITTITTVGYGDL